MIALTRRVSRTIGDCQLTFRDRDPIDADRAEEQQKRYEACLRDLGATVVTIPGDSAFPDCAFIEDTSVVVEEVAVLGRPGVASREGEIAAVAEFLREGRPVVSIEAPGTLEGGDVVRHEKTVYVGLSGRTNEEGAVQLRRHLEPHGYTVREVRVSGCLHLATACTFVGENTLLVNREWVDVEPFGDVSFLDVPESEPWAANTLRVKDTILMPTAFPETSSLLREAGFYVSLTEISEFLRAEGGVSCLSLRIPT